MMQILLNECSFSQESRRSLRPAPTTLRIYYRETDIYGHTRRSLRSLQLCGAFVGRMGSDLDHRRPACEKSSVARGHINGRGVLATEDPDRVVAFSPSFRRGFFGERFIGFSPAAQWTGVALTALGIAFTIWARVHI